MSAFSGMLSVEVRGGRQAAFDVAAKTEIFTRATSLGGVESSLERRRRWAGELPTVPDGLLRLTIKEVGDFTSTVGRIKPGDRAAMMRRPPHILVTTPESLYLLLTSQAREILRGVEHVIVDEVHAIAQSKRGDLLSVEFAGGGGAPDRDGLVALEQRFPKADAALAQVKDFDSPLGKFSFDANRDPLHEPLVLIVKNGKFEAYQP